MKLRDWLCLKVSLRNSAVLCDSAVMIAVKRVNRRAAENRRVTQREIRHQNRYRNIAAMTKDFWGKELAKQKPYLLLQQDTVLRLPLVPHLRRALLE